MAQRTTLNSSRACRTRSDSARTLHSRRQPTVVSVGADARGRTHRRATGDRRQRRADAAPDRRSGLQSRSARRRQPCGSARGRPCAARMLSIPATACGCERYREWRAADRSNIVRFTDGLVRLFSQPFGPIKALRDVGHARVRSHAGGEGRAVAAFAGCGRRIPNWRAARAGSMMRKPDFHILIVGGGMVGACAAALAAANPHLADLRIAVLEAHPPSLPPPDRVTSICACLPSRAPRNGSSPQIGAWPLVPAQFFHRTRT